MDASDEKGALHLDDHAHTRKLILIRRAFDRSIDNHIPDLVATVSRNKNSSVWVEGMGIWPLKATWIEICQSTRTWLLSFGS